MPRRFPHHLVFIALLLGFAPSVRAHPEGFSGLRIVVDQAKAQARLTLHTRDLTAWFPPTKFHNYVPDVCNELCKQPADILEIQLNDVTATASSVRAFSPEVGMVELDLTYAAPRPIESISIWSKHLGWLPRGHQQLLSIETPAGRAL